MSYQTSNDPKHGTIASSAGNPMTWDLTSDSGRAAMALTVTASANCNLYIQEAATAAELLSPPESLPHKFVIPIVANTSKRVIEGRDPSLPFGKAWLADGTGNYSLSGGRRANS